MYFWAAGVLIAGVLAAVASAGGNASTASAAALTDKAILFAADGMRPDLVDKYAAAGAMPEMKELMEDGVKGVNGLRQGFPPNTGVGWYTLATGTWPGRARLDEQHVPPHRRRRLQQQDIAREPASSRRTRSSRPPSAPARRSPRSSGSARARTTSGPGHRLPELLLDPRRPHVPARRERAGRCSRLRRLLSGRAVRTGRRLDEHARRRRRRQPAAADGADRGARRSPRRIRPEPTTSTSTTASSTACRRTTVSCSCGRASPRTPRKRRPTSRSDDWDEIRLVGLGRPHRRPRRTDRRVLREADRPRRQRRERELVQALLHVGHPRDRHAAPAIRTSRARSSISSRPRRPPTSRRSRPGSSTRTRTCSRASSGRTSTGRHLTYILTRRPAGHGPAARRHPGDRRVLAPVHGPRTRRRTSTAIRTRTTTTSRTTTSRTGASHPRGIHPIGVPRGRRDPRPRPLADGRRDDVRLLRPRLRAAVVRGQRVEGARRPRIRSRAELRTAAPSRRRSSRRARQAARPSSTSTSPGETRPRSLLAGPDLQQCAAGPAGQYETVRNNLVSYFQNLDDPQPAGPAAGRPGRLQEGAAAQRRRHGRPPSRTGPATSSSSSGRRTSRTRRRPGTLIAFSQFFGQHGYLPDLVDLADNINMHGTFIAAGRGSGSRTRSPAFARSTSPRRSHSS